jgi:geranylgeranyl reductase family protein
MTTLDRCDLLVVGAGPAGSALAAHAAGRGMDVILVERGTHPRPKACAEYASPRIADELARLGVDERSWRPQAVPLNGMRVHVDGTAFDVTYADRRGKRTAWGLDRPAFDAALAAHARAAGARLLERTAVTELAWRRGRVVGGSLRGPFGVVDVRARWVAGADGVRSTVARRVGAMARVRFPRRLGLVAHYEGTDAGRARMGQMHVGDGYYVGLAPLPGGRLNVAMAVPLNGRPGRATDRFDAAIDSLPAARAALRDATARTPIRGVAPIGQLVRSVAGPGWLLVGDAAGFVDPFTGEGIYRALRSARAAANALTSAAAEADDRVEPRYAAERRAAFAAKDTLTWVVQGLLAMPTLLAYAGRRLAARPAAAIRFGSALGDCRPASDALSPRFLWEVFRP